MSPSAEQPLDLRRIQRGALIVGAAALAVSAIYGVFRPAPFFRAYLIGFRFWLSFPLGCMALVMVQHLTGGLWGAVLRPILDYALLAWVVFQGPVLHRDVVGVEIVTV